MERAARCAAEAGENEPSPQKWFTYDALSDPDGSAGIRVLLETMRKNVEIEVDCLGGSDTISAVFRGGRPDGRSSFFMYGDGISAIPRGSSPCVSGRNG